MESAQWTTVALDVRVLLLSVLGCTVIAFFLSTLLATRLCRQPLGLGGTMVYALISTVAFFFTTAVVASLAPTQSGTLVGLLLCLLITQWLLARRLLPRLQRRNTKSPPAGAPAAWRMALIGSLASAAMLALVGFAQTAFFFSPPG